jgi:hypothetical protein
MHNHKANRSVLHGSILLEAMLAIMVLVVCFGVLTRIYGNWIRTSYQASQLLALLDQARSARSYYTTSLASKNDNAYRVHVIQISTPRTTAGGSLRIKHAVELACIAVSETDRYGVKRTVEIMTLPREYGHGTQAN